MEDQHLFHGDIKDSILKKLSSAVFICGSGIYIT